MINNIQTLDIQGVTGRIRFNNGDRIGEIVIEQILGRREKERLSLAFFSRIVSQSSKVDIVKLFVALPTNQSKYILLSAKNERNITWHGKQTKDFID